MRALKFMARVALVLLALVVILLAGATLLVPRLVDAAALCERIKEPLSQQWHGAVSCGSLRIRLLPLPHADVADVRLSIPQKADIGIRSLSIRPKLLPLFRGKVQLAEVRIESPAISARGPLRAAHGGGGPSGDSAVTVEAVSALAASGIVDRAVLKHGKANYTLEDGASVLLEDIDVDLTVRGAESPQVHLNAVVPIITMRRGGNDAVFRGTRLAATVKLEAQSVEATLDSLRLDSPPLQLSGRLSFAPGAVELQLDGENLNVEPLRAAAMLAAGEVGVVRKIFDVLRDGTVPVINFRSKAGLLQHLGHTEAFVLEGRLVEGRVHVPGVDLDLDDVAGQATVAGGVLSGEQVSARLHNSTATAGKFRVGLRGNPQELHVETPVQADAADIAALLRRLVHNQSFQRHLDRISDVTGKLSGTLLLDGTTKQPAVRAEASAFDLAGRVEGIGAPLLIHGGQFLYNAGGIEARQVDLRAGASTVTDVTLRLLPTSRSASFEATAGPSQLVLDEAYPWLAASGRLPHSAWIPESLRGNVAVNSLRITGPLARPTDWRLEMEGAVQVSAVAPGLPHVRMVTDYPVSLSDLSLKYAPGRNVSFAATVAAAGGINGTVDLDWSGNRLQVKSLNVRDRQSDAALTLVLTPDDVDLGFTGHLHKTTLDALIENPLPFASLEGDARARVPRNRPLQSVLEGRVTATDLTVSTGGDLPLKVPSVTLEGVSGALHVASRLKLGDGRVELKGQVRQADARLFADLDLSANHIDWADIEPLLPRGSAAKRAANTDATQSPFQAQLRIAADSFAFGRFTWHDVRGVADFARHRLSVQVTEANLCGVGTPGTITVEPKGLTLAFQPAAKAQLLESLVLCMGIDKKIATGQYDLTAGISAQGAASDLPRLVDGQFDFHSQKGRIYGTGVSGRILSVLASITGEVRSLPDITKEGLAFNRFIIGGNVKRSKLILERAILDGPSLAWAAEGSVDFVSRAVDLTFLVSPLKGADSVLAHIPIINRILGGNVVTYPVKVTGKLDDPKVHPVSPSAVGQGLMRVMKRTLDLPGIVVKPVQPAKRKP